MKPSAQGDEYRKAKPEIEAAVAKGANTSEIARYLSRSHTWVIANGASQREVSRYLDRSTKWVADVEVARYLARSRKWVQDVLAWDGTGTLYGKDTERCQ